MLGLQSQHGRDTSGYFQGLDRWCCTPPQEAWPCHLLVTSRKMTVVLAAGWQGLPWSVWLCWVVGSGPPQPLNHTYVQPSLPSVHDRAQPR